MSVETAKRGVVSPSSALKAKRRSRASGEWHYHGRNHVITDRALIATVQKANGLGKRLFDILVSLALLILLSPVLITVFALVKLSDSGPGLYGHKRIGRQARPFLCWKFRTMRTDGDQILAAHLAANPDAEKEWLETRKLTHDPRVTSIGDFLRKTSLDELPQLWNVLVGEMSMIGPRPIVRAELDRYGKDRRYYLLMRPGITGLWQVSGRSSTSYARRVELDRRYAENWSYSQDIDILFRTPMAVLKRDGAV